MRVRLAPDPIGAVVLTSLAALIVPAAGCTEAPGAVPDDAASVIVVTQTPTRAGRDVTIRPDFDARFPPGSRVVLVRDRAHPRVLSRDFQAAGAPALSPDGSSIVFAGRERPESPWAIFEVSLRRGRPRKVVESERDCGDPAYLADEKLVFTCSSAPSAWSLYTAPLRGGTVERITFGAGSAFDPHPMQDGRILFSMRRGDRTGERTASLFTVNPDGSMLSPLTDDHGAGEFLFRPRTALGNDVAFLAVAPDGQDSGAQRVDLGRPSAPRREWSLSLRPLAVEPLPDGGVLISGHPQFPAAGTAGVYRLNAAADRLEAVFDSPDWDEVEALAVTPRPRPLGRPSGLNPDSSFGTLICYDTGRSDRTIGPGPGAPRAATLAVQALRDDAGKNAPRAIDLGEVAVEPDGSVFLQVPPDVPIRVRSLDDGGREIATSSWFWVRPGEVRACFGCHESREAAPVNRPVAALAHDPASMVEPRAETRR